MTEAPLKIATWNVNSVKARLPNVLEWLERAAPDVALLQELKCETASFPYEAIEGLGYHAAVHGQKSWNGVAILSRGEEPRDVLRGLPGDETDVQARYIEATIGDFRIASIYLPNGNPVGTEKYPYKLSFMDRLKKHVVSLLDGDRPFVLGGDYNVIPEPVDVYDPSGWSDDALFRLETRRRFREILNLGLIDAYRILHPDTPRAYTFWDYQAGCWPMDKGLRIDHMLLDPRAADRLRSAAIDREPRGREKASDHTPLVIELDRTGPMTLAA